MMLAQACNLEFKLSAEHFGYLCWAAEQLLNESGWWFKLCYAYVALVLLKINFNLELYKNIYEI